MVCCGAAAVGVGTCVPLTAALRDYPLYTGQTVRYLIAGVLLTALVRRRRRPRRRPNTGQLARLALLALVGMVLFNVALLHASAHSEPSTLGAMLGVCPVLLAVFGPIVERGRVRPRLVLCAATVGVGVALVHGGGSATAAGFALALAAAGCEVGFALIAGSLVADLGALRVSAWASWLAVPPFLAVAVLTPGPQLVLPTVGQLTVLCLLATIGAVAAVAWYTGLNRLGADQAGLFLGLTPIAALTGSLLLGQEQLTATTLIGILLISAAISAALASTPRRTGIPAPAPTRGPGATPPTVT